MGGGRGGGDGTLVLLQFAVEIQLHPHARVATVVCAHACTTLYATTGKSVAKSSQLPEVWSPFDFANNIAFRWSVVPDTSKVRKVERVAFVLFCHTGTCMCTSTDR